MTQKRAPRRAPLAQSPDGCRGVGLQYEAAAASFRRPDRPPHRVNCNSEFLVVDVSRSRGASQPTAYCHMPRGWIEWRFELGRPRVLNFPRINKIARLRPRPHAFPPQLAMGNLARVDNPGPIIACVGLQDNFRDGPREI